MSNKITVTPQSWASYSPFRYIFWLTINVAEMRADSRGSALPALLIEVSFFCTLLAS